MGKKEPRTDAGLQPCVDGGSEVADDVTVLADGAGQDGRGPCSVHRAHVGYLPMVTSAPDASARLRLAFVGCGAIAEWHLAALRAAAPRTDVTAVVDVDRGRALAMSEQTGAPAFASLDEALGADGFDAALVMVPHLFHEELALT